MRGGHLLKHWSSTQQTVALSSGEAELKGIVKGAAEGIGMQNIAKDLSIYYDIHLFTDSSAAMGMVARNGMGKVRHIEVGELWIQDAVRNKALTVHKVKGDDNPADILTKYHVDLSPEAIVVSNCMCACFLFVAGIQEGLEGIARVFPRVWEELGELGGIYESLGGAVRALRTWEI